jgi:hypothetical protein
LLLPIIAASVAAGVLLIRASHPATHASPVARKQSGTLNGQLLYAGGPFPSPRAEADQTFQLSSIAGSDVYTVRTDKQGRFVIHVKPGTYYFSMPHMLLQGAGLPSASNRHYLLRLRAGQALRRTLLVTSPGAWVAI